MTGRWRLHRAVVAVMAVGCACAGAPASAQTVGPAPQQAKPGKAAAARPEADPAAAEKALELGIHSYDAGKLEPAVGALSAALQHGGLREPSMGRALYYRGMAYRKLGKPAQAISDLTSALWLKTALTESQRADAMKQRAEAYREAGLGEAPSTTAAVVPPAASEPAKPEPTRTAKAEPAAEPARPAPVASGAAIASASPAPSSSSGGFGFGNVFGGLFGGSAAAPAPAAPPPPVTVAAATVEARPAPAAAGPAAAPAAAAPLIAAPPPAPPATTGSIGPAVSSWNQPATADKPAPQTKVGAATVAVAAATPPLAPAPRVSANGHFRVQVAAVRSRDEADAVVARLKNEMSGKLAAAEPSVDEAVFGNMGTFYRVRLGPYASAQEAGRVCAGLKAGGFDCLMNQN
jgi:tetratricopeptide (TPR) repeat protein